MVWSAGTWLFPESLCNTSTNATNPSSILSPCGPPESQCNSKSTTREDSKAHDVHRHVECEDEKKKKRFVSCSGPLPSALFREVPQMMKPRMPASPWLFLCGMWIYLETCSRVGSEFRLTLNLQEPFRLGRDWIMFTSCVPLQSGQKVIHDLSSYFTERLSRCHKAVETRAGACDSI